MNFSLGVSLVLIKPFFLYFATHGIHVPRVPHPRFVGRTAMGARGDAIVQFDWQVGEILAADPLPAFDPKKTYDLGSLVELGMANNPKTRSAFFTARAAGAAARARRRLRDLFGARLTD